MNKNLLLLLCLSLFMFSCTKDEDSKTIKESSSTTSSSNTEVVINIIDSQSNPKPGYTVLMFLEKPALNTPLPKIEMEVLSNSEGIANFDLDDFIGSPRTLYFEACFKIGENYILEGINHPSKTISKGTKWTTSILVE